MRFRSAAASSTFLSRSAFGDAGHAQAEADIVADRHVRIERVALEHHREAALRRRLVDDVDAVDQDGAAGRVLEPGDQAEQRRLSAAGRADEDDERAVLHDEVDALDDLHVAEGLLDALEFDLAHDPSPYFTAPKVSPRTSCFWLNQPMMRMGAMAMVEAAESLA